MPIELFESDPHTPDHWLLALSLWLAIQRGTDNVKQQLAQLKARNAAFILEQETSRRADFCDHRVTIDEIERRSDLDFFHGLSDDEQDELETPPGGLESRLGCVTQ